LYPVETWSIIEPAMGKVFGSSGQTSNPFGTVGVLTGLIGAVFSVLLWIHFYQPDTTILGTYSPQIQNGQLGDQMSMLAAVFGVMAILSGIGGGLGGKGSSTTVASLLLGIVGVSFPVLTALNIVENYVPNPVR
jgi:hypothetical protein